MEDKQLTLVEHLSELRKRIIIIFIAIILGSFLGYKYIDIMVEYIVKPAKKLEFIYLSPPELFVAYIKIAVIVGIIISSPISLMQIWLFVKPGLKRNERRYLLFSLYMGIMFFLIGVTFAYLVIIPLTIDFFTQVSMKQITPLFSFDSYLSFVSSMLFSFGLVFELPLLIILLTQLNLITAKTLKKYRKVVILLIFILAAILTPPDVVSQILLALPMVFLYEFSIWVSAGIGKRKNKKGD
ncbi:twin-arginine translocase subunit TatC [Tissierella praeacuta]|uniref:twin-arginine translocase subunit TatC n=1 Tax=Tissierella praeacuta TaxID=43131 RepID=UPI003340E45A